MYIGAIVCFIWTADKMRMVTTTLTLIISLLVNIMLPCADVHYMAIHTAGRVYRHSQFSRVGLGLRLREHIKHTTAHNGADVHRNLPKTTENSVIIRV